MATDPNVEQAVSRALRDSLGRLQRTADELNQAIADFVAACASSRPTNALPPMLRAQTAAAALAAALEVLSRFVTAALQPAQRTPAEEEVLRLVSLPAPETSRPAPPMPPTPVPMGEAAAPEAVAETTIEATTLEPVADREIAAELPATLDLASLSVEQQELHRRANRVAKVSMQDIKMLRPEHVRLGRQNKDLCVRLRDEIEKAHREYERRFRAILDHPVDYFHYWMVEILAGGDPEALGEYPYPSPLLRR